MKATKKIFVLLVLLVTQLCVSQTFSLDGVNLHVSKNNVLTLDIPEAEESGIVKRTVEIARVITYEGYTYRKVKSTISLRKKSNKSRRAMLPGKYELLVTKYVNGAVSKNKQLFEVI